MGSTKSKKRERKDKHFLNKARSKLNRILKKHHYSLNDTEHENFQSILRELNNLNLRQLTLILLDLRNNGYKPPWSGDYHLSLLTNIESFIFEKTILR